MAGNKKMYWGCLFANHEIHPVGWFEMSDWDAGADEVQQRIYKLEKEIDSEAVHWIRDDCIDDLILDLKVLRNSMKGKP
jgi:hypothetical protein